MRTIPFLALIVIGFCSCEPKSCIVAPQSIKLGQELSVVNCTDRYRELTWVLNGAGYSDSLVSSNSFVVRPTRFGELNIKLIADNGLRQATETHTTTVLAPSLESATIIEKNQSLLDFEKDASMQGYIRWHGDHSWIAEYEHENFEPLNSNEEISIRGIGYPGSIDKPSLSYFVSTESDTTHLKFEIADSLVAFSHDKNVPILFSSGDYEIWMKLKFRWVVNYYSVTQ